MFKDNKLVAQLERAFHNVTETPTPGVQQMETLERWSSVTWRWTGRSPGVAQQRTERYPLPAPRPYSFIFRQSVVREMPSRRALTETFPLSSASTRAMCDRSTSARLQAVG